MIKLLLTSVLLLSIIIADTQNVINSNRKTQLPAQLTKLNEHPAELVISENVLNNPTALSRFVQKNKSFRSSSNVVNYISNAKLLAGAACADSSFVKLAGIVDNAFYISTIIHTKDDAVLIVAYGLSATIAPYGWQLYGILMKVDNMGNILWTKYYRDEQNRPKFEVLPSFVKELNNGDILTVCSLDTAQGNTSEDEKNHHMLLTRLDAAGNVLWYKTFNTLLSTYHRFHPFDVNSVVEAPNGDLILAGTAMYSNGLILKETVVRMDNAGNKIWDVFFDNRNDDGDLSEGIAVFLDNGKVIVAGMELDVSAVYSLVNSFHFLTLDFNTGALLSKRSFTPSYNDIRLQFKNLTPYRNNCIRLDNGHYLLWGENYTSDSRELPITDYFVVIEFDERFNFLDAYSLSGTVKSSYDSDALYFNSDGRGLFQVYGNPATIFQGSIFNKQLRKQRAKSFANISTGMATRYGPNQVFCFFNDSSYLHATSYLEDFRYENSFLQFRKLHDSDTSSFCLGYDSIALKVMPYLVSEDATVNMEQPLTDKLNLTDVRVTYTNETNFRYKNPCEQKSFCDTIKIHGDTIICNNTQARTFSVYKNPLCGSFAEWTIDTTVISSFDVLNDTSVSITFKDVNWNGKIYASLSTGRCTMPIHDSLPIHIVKAMTPVSLGDTLVICPGNTIVLHAGPGFKNYRWQDASTDSIYTVTHAGKYFVETNDYCGNIFSDTVIINPAGFNFSLGPDTIKCNNETITLSAPAGFSNYQWTQAYNILSGGGNSASVFPAVDTSYIVTAEKSAGCIVRDTIRITVLHSPKLNLGDDISICAGSQLRLNAGPGFDAYAWNTGSVSQTIDITDAGSYSVKALYNNGCYSGDTLKILAVIPLPLFSLGNGTDTLLCEGQKLKYNLAIPGTYLWNDGSVTNIKEIATPGLTWLRITNQGCSFSDSIRLSFKLSPAVNIGNDTTLCEGATKLLNATSNNASYIWQDGSSTATFLVKSPGSYSVKLSLNGCSKADTVSVSYNYKPSFSLGEDKFICEGQQLLLQPSGALASSYEWQNGNTNPSFTVTSAGLYSLTGMNNCGTFTDVVKIDMGPCKFWLPSAFTPNADAKNDLFRLKYPFPVKQFILSIFNRWGQKVFETKDISFAWNGSFKGKEQPADVYIWVASITYPDDKKEENKGIITLIR